MLFAFAVDPQLLQQYIFSERLQSVVSRGVTPCPQPDNVLRLESKVQMSKLRMLQ